MTNEGVVALHKARFELGFKVGLYLLRNLLSESSFPFGPSSRSPLGGIALKAHFGTRPFL